MARATWDDDAKLAGKPRAFGARVRRLRAKRRLTLDWLSAETRRSKSFLSDIENGKRMCGADTLERLADVFGVTMDDLWRGIGKCDPAELADLAPTPTPENAR